MEKGITHIQDGDSKSVERTINVDALETAIWKIIKQTASNVACAALIRLPLNESLTRNYKPTLENKLIQFFNRQGGFKFRPGSLIKVDRGSGKTYPGILYSVKKCENGKYTLANVNAKPPYDREEVYDKYWVEKHFQYMQMIQQA